MGRAVPTGMRPVRQGPQLFGASIPDTMRECRLGLGVAKAPRPRLSPVYSPLFEALGNGGRRGLQALPLPGPNPVTVTCCISGTKAFFKIIKANLICILH
jgi:hypothetical protein